MPDAHPATKTLTEQDVATIARYAGLTIPEERLASVTREVNLARSAVDDLLSFKPTDIAGVGDRFDPAWPSDPKRGEQ